MITVGERKRDAPRDDDVALTLLAMTGWIKKPGLLRIADTPRNDADCDSQRGCKELDCFGANALRNDGELDCFVADNYC